MNESRLAVLEAAYDTFAAQQLKLDLTRGKPAPEQLDLSNDLDGILEGFFLLQDGTDVRNYGGIMGIPEARILGAAIFGTSADQVMVGGNSSLNLMYQYIDHMRSRWGDARREDQHIKFLCPVPGYDRHFTICEHFDIEMIPVPLNPDGPDMDVVQALVESDPNIKGIWCVPKYSNPTGQTYSEKVVKAFAKLPLTAGSDFQIFWDNAYVVHDLADKGDELECLLNLANEQGAQDNIVMLASTSKITFAGAGISFLSASTPQLQAFEKYLTNQMIGFDKVNQFRHVRFLKDNEGIAAHMAKHRSVIGPKFDLVLSKLSDALGGKDIATWTEPRGGYFISLDTKPGLASEIIRMAGDVGVKLTPAGATFPYGKDPEDTNIRIAPTFPGLAELSQAIDVLVTCIELATLKAAQS